MSVLSHSMVLGQKMLNVQEMRDRMLTSSIKMDTARPSVHQNSYRNMRSTQRDSFRMPSEFNMATNVHTSPGQYMEDMRDFTPQQTTRTAFKEKLAQLQ